MFTKVAMEANTASANASRKRRRSERLFAFRTFGEPGCPCDYDGAFRNNIRAFLQSVAEREIYDVEGRPAWSISLQVQLPEGNPVVPLYIVEEDISTSPQPHCIHCRCVGWSHHMVSRRRYHFIIPSPEIGNRPLGAAAASSSVKICPSCYETLKPSAICCSSCNVEAIQTSILDHQGHLLHGFLHCNGFGHLVCVNGKEKGSRHVAGRELVDLWDRICAMLRARKVSVEDLSKKRSLEFRLLHCVAYGESWFSRWGYRFGHGSFGITHQMYSKAIEAIRGMPLNVLIQHFEGIDQDVIAIATRYQRISGQILQTVGDLIRFMSELKSRLPELPATPVNGPTTGPNSHKNFAKNHAQDSQRSSSKSSSGPPVTISFNTENTPACRWSLKRLELATQVIVEALKNSEKKWMPRQDVRDAARIYIGDTGLLDFVLKSLGNKVVGEHIVRRAVNPVTKVLEYSLEEAAALAQGETIDQKPVIVQQSATTLAAPQSRTAPQAPACEVSRSECIRDILYLYKHVLENYKPAARRGGRSSILSSIPTASRIILDTKQMIKDYRGEITRRAAASDQWGMVQQREDGLIRVLCSARIVDLSDGEVVNTTNNNDVFNDGLYSLDDLEIDDIVDPSSFYDQDQSCISNFLLLEPGPDELQLPTGSSGGDEILDDMLDVLLQSSSTTTSSCSTTTSSSGYGHKNNNCNSVTTPNCSASCRSGGSTITSACDDFLQVPTVSVGKRRADPPPEIIILPPHATVGELRREAERAFRDCYIIMQNLKIDRLTVTHSDEHQQFSDGDLLFGNVESGSQVIVHGSCGMHLLNDHHQQLCYEGGPDNWVVDCPCGTKDDDGERMIACDLCEVWQHTRCGNIADSDAIPQHFLCLTCASNVMQPVSSHGKFNMPAFSDHIELSQLISLPSHNLLSSPSFSVLM